MKYIDSREASQLYNSSQMRKESYTDRNLDISSLLKPNVADFLRKNQSKSNTKYHVEIKNNDVIFTTISEHHLSLNVLNSLLISENFEERRDCQIKNDRGCEINGRIVGRPRYIDNSHSEYVSHSRDHFDINRVNLDSKFMYTEDKAGCFDQERQRIINFYENEIKKIKQNANECSDKVRFSNQKALYEMENQQNFTPSYERDYKEFYANKGMSSGDMTSSNSTNVHPSQMNVIKTENYSSAKPMKQEEVSRVDTKPMQQTPVSEVDNNKLKVSDSDQAVKKPKRARKKANENTGLKETAGVKPEPIKQANNDVKARNAGSKRSVKKGNEDVDLDQKVKNELAAIDDLVNLHANLSQDKKLKSTVSQSRLFSSQAPIRQPKTIENSMSSSQNVESSIEVSKEEMLQEQINGLKKLYKTDLSESQDDTTFFNVITENNIIFHKDKYEEMIQKIYKKQNDISDNKKVDFIGKLKDKYKCFWFSTSSSSYEFFNRLDEAFVSAWQAYLLYLCDLDILIKGEDTQFGYFRFKNTN